MRTSVVPGAGAQKLVTRGVLSLMRKGSVIVDVAIDQGGCFVISCSTTRADPTYDYPIALLLISPGSSARVKPATLFNQSGMVASFGLNGR